MKSKHLMNVLILVIIIVYISGGYSCKRNEAIDESEERLGRNYYINFQGDDTNDGSFNYPWRSLLNVQTTDFEPGDSLLLEGGKIFDGRLFFDAADSGQLQAPVVVSSYGNGKAIINSYEKEAMYILNGKHLEIRDLILTGAGRKEGNTSSGLVVSLSRYIQLDSLEINGYQKSGLLIYKCADIKLVSIYAHNNGYAGISIAGSGVSKLENRRISMHYCVVENNPGDPTNLNNHSGNGIVIGQCTDVEISYCSAFNNGWDMPRIGNGPVGIWAWDADSVSIEHCLSFRNKTSKGGADGGGFDFDGGVTNSTLQYCLSFENEGSGIGLFQYDQAGVWNNNTIRFNISINDGWVSGAKAGLLIWSASPGNPLSNCKIYNNTIINEKFAAVGFSPNTDYRAFAFINNIFIGKSEILRGDYRDANFYGNCWWSMLSGFKIESFNDLAVWRVQRNQEQFDGNPTGVNFNPLFLEFDDIQIRDARFLGGFTLTIPNNPNLNSTGLNVASQLGYITDNKDFYGNVPPANGIGACFPIR